MKPKKIITWSEFKVADEVYHISVYTYDEELNHVTANWLRASDNTEGELGYGISGCESAIRLAEIAILKSRKA